MKKVISGTIILFISSLLIPYYNADALLQVVLDKMTLLVIFSIMLMTCIKYKKTDGIILCYFIIVLLRYLDSTNSKRKESRNNVILFSYDHTIPS